MDLIDKLALNSFLPWHFYFLLAQLMVLAFIRLSTQSSWFQWFALILNNDGEQDISRNHTLTRFFTLLGLVNLSFSLYIIAGDLSFLPFGFEDQRGFLIFLFLGALWLVCYMLVFNLAHWLSFEQPLFLKAKDSFYQVFKFYALLGLPVNVILIFTPISALEIVEIVVLILIFGLILRRLFLGVVQAISKGVSIWYIILYLCALEITPLLCVIKSAS